MPYQEIKLNHYMLLQHTLKLSFIINLIIFSTVLNAQKSPNFETIPYQGYRLELTDLNQKYSTSTTDQSFTATVINSGKFPITLGKSIENYQNLQVIVAEHFLFDKYPELKDGLIRSILNEKIILEPGQLFKNIKLNAGTIANKLTEQNTDAVPPVKNSLKPKKDKKEKKISNKLKKETTADPDIIPQESVAVVPENENLSDSAMVKADTKKCPDLVISNVTILKETKRMLQVECILVNQGNEQAPIHKYKKNGIENISFAAYFSASSKMSRGSVLAGGIVIRKGLEKSDGNLLPGASMAIKFEISLEEKSRFLNSLIISADSRQLIYECKETNNNFSLQLK